MLHFMQFLCRHHIASRASLRAHCAFNAILLYSINFGACSCKFQSGFKAVACRVNPSFMRHALSFSRRRSCDDIYCRDMLATAQHVGSHVEGFVAQRRRLNRACVAIICLRTGRNGEMIVNSSAGKVRPIYIFFLLLREKKNGACFENVSCARITLG